MFDNIFLSHHILYLPNFVTLGDALRPLDFISCFRITRCRNLQAIEHVRFFNEYQKFYQANIYETIVELALDHQL